MQACARPKAQRRRKPLRDKLLGKRMEGNIKARFDSELINGHFKNKVNEWMLKFHFTEREKNGAERESSTEK